MIKLVMADLFEGERGEGWGEGREGELLTASN